jgi:putative transcriptional regulator
MTHDEVMESTRGRLLIANGSLLDPNFRRAVVLVADHDDEGAAGVVLNRRSETTVAEAAPPLAPMAGSDEPVFVGGPIQPEAAVVLADFANPELATHLVLGSIGLVTGEEGADAIESIRKARVFAGYAGWGPGQLDAELEEEAWLVEDALPGDVFTDQPERLWSTVVRRKGKDYAMLAMMPDDPSLN